MANEISDKSDLVGLLLVEMRKSGNLTAFRLNRYASEWVVFVPGMKFEVVAHTVMSAPDIVGGLTTKIGGVLVGWFRDQHRCFEPLLAILNESPFDGREISSRSESLFSNLPRILTLLCEEFSEG